LLLTPRPAPISIGGGEAGAGRAGVKCITDGCERAAASRQISITSNTAFQSMNEPCFSVPTWHHGGQGAQRKGWEKQSHGSNASTGPSPQ
jgi:hypothetical protein